MLIEYYLKERIVLFENFQEKSGLFLQKSEFLSFKLKGLKEELELIIKKHESLLFKFETLSKKKRVFSRKAFYIKKIVDEPKKVKKLIVEWQEFMSCFKKIILVTQLKIKKRIKVSLNFLSQITTTLPLYEMLSETSEEIFQSFDTFHFNLSQRYQETTKIAQLSLEGIYENE